MDAMREANQAPRTRQRGRALTVLPKRTMKGMPASKAVLIHSAIFGLGLKPKEACDAVACAHLWESMCLDFACHAAKHHDICYEISRMS